MKIDLREGLPFVSASVYHRGQSVVLESVLLDTGSAGTILSTDRLAEIGIRYEPYDPIYRIWGIGGAEFVYAKRVDRLDVNGLAVTGFEIEAGALEYGLDLDGIIGTDFLVAVGALELRGAAASP